MMVPSFTADDVDVLFEWLLSPLESSSSSAQPPSLSYASSAPPALASSMRTNPSHSATSSSMKAKVLELFYEEFRQKPHLESHLRVASGNYYPLSSFSLILSFPFIPHHSHFIFFSFSPSFFSFLF
jgi:hypothetical protein